MQNNDELFREIADKYAEQYGATLREELAQIELHAAAPSTDNLERRVHKRIAAEKRRPYLRVATALAACLVIVLLLPYIFKLSIYSPSTSDSAPPIISATPKPPASDQTSRPQPEFAAIPLSASLPDGFSQIGFEQDLEKSIYYIEDAYLDDVVLTMEEARDPPDTGGLVEILIGDSVAFGTQTDGYSLLTFERDNVLYEMTCRHDINTLIKLGEALL